MFLAAAGPSGCVSNALAAGEARYPPTRVFTAEDARNLDALRLSPVILQERVPGMDVCVTVVGDAAFSCEIDARETRSPNLRGDLPGRLRQRVSPLTKRNRSITIWPYGRSGRSPNSPLG